ncbi:MAG: hypothetical protein JSU73_12720, partial [candidate division WOR-3 bacterium]
TSGRGGKSEVVRLVRGSGKVALQPEHGFKYRFRVLGYQSSEHRVNVIERLKVDRLVFTYTYPEYSGLEEYRSTSPDVVCLAGTRIGFKGKVSRGVDAGRFVLAGDTAEVRTAEHGEFEGEFLVRRDGEGRIELLDAFGGEFQAVELVRVRTVPDEYPLLKVFMPGRNVDLPMSQQIVLGVNSLDDYGLGGLYLHFGQDSADDRVRIKGLGGRREDTTFYTWDLSEAGLLPGDELKYFVSVSDNDAVSGPKFTRSEVFSVRFPTMTEIFNASVRKTEWTAQELEPMREEQEELGKELERIAEQFKREGELSWDEQQALEQLLADQGELAQEIGELSQEVGRMMDELFQGMALDAETMQRLGQLQELLSELLPRELQESLRRLSEQLQQETPDIRQALDQFQLDQEQLRAGIEQALEFLNRVLEEQRLEALAREAEELAKSQDEILERLDLGETPDKAQERLGQDLDSLLKELQDLASTMSDSAIAESLAALSEQASEDRLSQMSEQAMSGMQQANMRQAKSAGKRLSGKLKDMSQSLSSLSQSLKKKRSSEVAKQLAAAAEQLLTVSERQEELEKELGDLESLAPRAERQMSFHDATGIVAESLVALGGRTMATTSRIAADLAGTMLMMKTAAGEMVENQRGLAVRHMGEARAGLDRAVVMLLAALASAQQGGGMSGGMESLLEQLSEMTAEQMGINSGMSGIPLPIPGGMSASQMQALGRLLAAQRALREKLEQMLQSMAGEKPGLTSSLEGLVEDMKQVEEDMADLNVTRELIERQESILSHLLDAQRSVRQQGYKEERESETAREFRIERAPSLPEDRGDRNRLLREELMRALKEGDLGEYEQLVRAYFELLMETGPEEAPE